MKKELLYRKMERYQSRCYSFQFFDEGICAFKYSMWQVARNNGQFIQLPLY